MYNFLIKKYNKNKTITKIKAKQTKTKLKLGHLQNVMLHVMTNSCTVIVFIFDHVFIALFTV